MSNMRRGKLKQDSFSLVCAVVRTVFFSFLFFLGGGVLVGLGRRVLMEITVKVRYC